MEFLLPGLWIVIGIVLLVWSADRAVIGASATARNFGIAPMLVGLTVVALGTSAPEIFVSLVASLRGNAGVAIGNAIGSNIANIGLVIGTTALLHPLDVDSKTLRREFPILFVIMFVVGALLLDGRLGRIDGFILLIGFGALVTWLVRLGHQQVNVNNGVKSGPDAMTADPLAAEFAAEIPSDMPTARAVMWTVVGLIGLPIAAEIFVHGAVQIATLLGVSDLVIGLSIVAIGTSLPEMAASLMGAFKNEHDIAVGNVLGSNMFNLLAVLAFPGLLHPLALDPAVMRRDYPIMVGFTLVFYCVAALKRKHNHVTRWEGALLLLGYISYLFLLASTV